MKRYFYYFIFLALGGCARVTPLNEDDVLCDVRSRIGAEAYSEKTLPTNDLVCQLLESPKITNEIAVQIAIFNNPEIQVQFENLGIAHADLYQAILYKNPFYDFSYRFPRNPNLIADINLSFLQSVVDILVQPFRKKVASIALERVKKEVAFAILDLAFDVQDAYFALLKELLMKKSLILIADAAETISLIAAEQYETGNINQIEYLNYQKIYADKSSSISDSDRRISIFAFNLEKLLGIDSSCIIDKISLEFPPIEPLEKSLEEVEEIALEQRLDYQAICFDIERINESRLLKRAWVYTELATGVSLERDSGNILVIGPELAGVLPIFDYGQAARRRLIAELNQKIYASWSLRHTILTDVKEKYFKVKKICGTAMELEKTIVDKEKEKKDPLHDLYNIMGATVYDLLEQKIAEYETNRNYYETLSDCLISKVELMRATGGKI